MTLGFKLPAVSVVWKNVLFEFGLPPYETVAIETVIHSVFQTRFEREPTSEELERIRYLFSQSLLHRIKVKNHMRGRICVAQTG